MFSTYLIRSLGVAAKNVLNDKRRNNPNVHHQDTKTYPCKV